MNRREFLTRIGHGAALAAAGMSVTRGAAGAAQAQAAQEGTGMLKVVDKGVVYDKSTALIAGTCLCSNGNLLVSFNSSGDLGAGEKAGIVRSSDGGKTWGDPEIWFESMFKRGGIEVGCSLTCLSNGRLLLPYADGFYFRPVDWSDAEALKRPETFYRHALLFCPTSDDNGQTWQNTKAECFEGIEGFAFGTVAELPDSTLLLPLWGSYDVQGAWQAGVLKSKDGGETWGDYRAITKENSTETPVLQLPDGRVIALIRDYKNQGALFVSYSSDAGDTWSEPQETTMRGSSPALYLSPKGRLLAGYRSTLEGGQCHVSSSTDGGQTWTFEVELQLPRETWSYGGYPTFATLPDGRIFVPFHNRKPDWNVAYNILEEA